MSVANGDRLHVLVRRFRILRGWRVRWGKSGTMYGQAAVFPKARQAWIFPWGAESTEPQDFLLHEVLHCALGALTVMDRRKPKELKQAEESLIRDICGVFLNPSKSKCWLGFPHPRQHQQHGEGERS